MERIAEKKARHPFLGKKREVVLKTAAALFRNQGYERASLNDLANILQITKDPRFTTTSTARSSCSSISSGRLRARSWRPSPRPRRWGAPLATTSCGGS